ncbi:Response regulator receiver domain-containing protein [Cyclobacterium lianum]|uniref:Response regulator receiver domain-containing protein n=1 Tax=Cyclobacterium lianum TaxID=388280 RepID=A0A1M7LCH3_9BACT|nr:Response regulator receiver domain-containing protein [Cyclobacterium lianum]
MVDDDPIVILLQKKLMEKAGIEQEVTSFNNGEELVDFIADQAPGSEDYLMFLDINMPGLSGWDVLDMLESMNVPQNIEVIIITSSIEPADKRKAKNYKRIVDFWVKPFSIQDFIQFKEKFKL